MTIKIKFSISLLFVMTMAGQVIAQSGFGSISGYVRDVDGNIPDKASIVVVETALGAWADSTGYFRITGIPVGTYNVRVYATRDGETNTADVIGLLVRSNKTEKILVLWHGVDSAHKEMYCFPLSPLVDTDPSTSKTFDGEGDRIPDQTELRCDYSWPSRTAEPWEFPFEKLWPNLDSTRTQ